MTVLDPKDRRILRELQRDSSQSIEGLATRVHLSRNAAGGASGCWKRKASSAAAWRSLIPARINLGLTAFIAVKTAQHEPKWLEKFSAAVKDIPEIIGAYRTTGDTDYLLHAVVSDVAGYDRLYKRLIARIPLTDVSSSFVMEKIKETTALPLDPE